MRGIGRKRRNLACDNDAPAPARARPTFVRASAMHHGGGMIEAILKEMLVGGVANRLRHFAVAVGDHTVGRNDREAFNAKHRRSASEQREIFQKRYYAEDDDDHP